MLALVRQLDTCEQRRQHLVVQRRKAAAMLPCACATTIHRLQTLRPLPRCSHERLGRLPPAPPPHAHSVPKRLLRDMEGSRAHLGAGKNAFWGPDIKTALTHSLFGAAFFLCSHSMVNPVCLNMALLRNSGLTKSHNLNGAKLTSVSRSGQFRPTNPGGRRFFKHHGDDGGLSGVLGGVVDHVDTRAAAACQPPGRPPASVCV